MSEHQPGGSSDHTIVIHVTRGSLFLIAVLLLLLLGLLAILFPRWLVSGAAPSNAAPAGAVMVLVVTATPDPQSGPVSAIPTAIATGPSPVALNSYPAPQTAGQATSVIPPAPSVTPPGLPTFLPTRPTQVPASFLPSPAGSAFIQEDDQALPASPATAQPVRAAAMEAPTIATAVPARVVQPTLVVIRNQLAPSSDGGGDAGPQLAAPRGPAPAPPKILKGTIKWTSGQVKLDGNYRLVGGATLNIEPGVEVLFTAGSSLFVEGTLLALGAENRPVRFDGLLLPGRQDQYQQWGGIFGSPGSNITLRHVVMHNGGAGGTLITNESGNLVVQNSHIQKNRGQIRVLNSRVDVRNNVIEGNEIPYGAALDLTFTRGNDVILHDNRIVNNMLPNNATPIQIVSRSPGGIQLDVWRNLVQGQGGPEMVLYANTQMRGELACNTLFGGANGLSVHSDNPQTFQLELKIHENAIERHTPPIIPIYLEYGIGRGATSETPLDMSYNWWESSVGPYSPDRYADGRGEAVGSNITFQPWLTERPGCAPVP